MLADLGRLPAGPGARPRRCLARYGGEEFIVVLRQAFGTSHEAAERLRRGWNLRQPRATFSVGVAVHERDRSAATTFAEADAALYEAKRLGRDQVFRYSPEAFQATGSGLPAVVATSAPSELRFERIGDRPSANRPGAPRPEVL